MRLGTTRSRRLIRRFTEVIDASEHWSRWLAWMRVVSDHDGWCGFLEMKRINIKPTAIPIYLAGATLTDGGARI